MKLRNHMVWILTALAVLTGAARASDQDAKELTTEQRYFERLKQESESGKADISFRLGTMYYFGTGCETNLVEAAKWIRKAAESGHALAQYRLGYMLFKGEGVAANPEEAHWWMMTAAEQGDPDATGVAARILVNAKGVTDEEYRRTVDEQRRSLREMDDWVLSDETSLEPFEEAEAVQEDVEAKAESPAAVRKLSLEQLQAVFERYRALQEAKQKHMGSTVFIVVSVVLVAMALVGWAMYAYARRNLL
jgi:TPR repeat protein